MIKIIGVGDILPGGLLHGTNQKFISEAVLALMNKGDVRVGTLECAIGNTPDFSEEKMSRYADVIYAPDEDLKRLKEMRIDIVSLANNHFFDLKECGARHTIHMLDELGIKHCGAGMNIEEARKPVVIEKEGKTIAFLAFCDIHKYMGFIPVATENNAGVNPLEEDYVVTEIQSAKKQFDYVVVMPHWGREHTFETTIWCYQMANKMLRAGADLILGSHTHRVQSIVNKQGKSIAFSMGNFCFPDRLIAPPLRVTFYPEETVDLASLPVTYKYPEVKELTYKIWIPLARYGMIVLATINNGRVKSIYRLTHIDENNFIDFAERNTEVERGLSKYHFLLKHTPYRYSIPLKNKMGALVNRLRNVKNK